ncbi:MAG: 3'(2'),5'-bisphosphate nucleotidase CysQ [Marinicaulis sp.]|nr:3'(2'),5'-bisphosphate nucleotidase CysQ [Marinicaulis sp.]NNE39501.1 3'(2'),5'-bisphosphate nucleotidase CysQ [Marinicaulis sp.]NNL89222.1 3'(2'),5'-bisphosphate nucleotidase CysQ [Marinicaulis sp.]
MNRETYLTDEFTDELAKIALLAGRCIMNFYENGAEVTSKADNSPVTDADRAAEKIILSELARLAPGIPILAEECASEGNIPELGDLFFLVDPLDGTKEFINKTGEFTVNIALIEKERPISGVVYAPAINVLYAGRTGAGAWKANSTVDFTLEERSPIATRNIPENGLTAVASRSHRSPETDEFLEKLEVKDFAAAGSSLKFCLLAEGKADVYPRLGRTMEWDTGAGQAVLEAAGGCVQIHPYGDQLTYRKISRGYDNPFFIAWGRTPMRAAP